MAYLVQGAVDPGGGVLGAFFRNFVHPGLMLAGTGICLWRAGARRSTRGERGAWVALAVALGTYAAGETAWNHMYAGLEEPPVPSLADGLWLVFYPASYLALVLLVRARVPRLHASLVLDGLVGALALAAFGAAVVHPAVEGATGGEPLVVATTLAYPLGDLLLLGVVIGVFALTGWRPGRTWLLLGLGLATNAVADVIYTYQTATNTFVEGSVYDALFPAAALPIAFAALQPGDGERTIRLDSRRLLLIPGAFALSAVGLLAYGLVGRLSPTADALALCTLVAVIVRAGLTFAANVRLLETVRTESLTDALTSLPNRRSLMRDLAEETERSEEGVARALVIFDLDGFKRYNDLFGHPAGDGLLCRLGQAFDRAAGPFGRAYRLGGDEFCMLTDEGADVHRAVAAATAALGEQGEGFSITCCHGLALIPDEAPDAARALQVADQRLYRAKDRRPSVRARDLRETLLDALRDRPSGLHRDAREVSKLAGDVARRLGLVSEELDEVLRAGELHDIGKMAIPEEVLSKPAPLDEDELALMRRHTVIGEQMVAMASPLKPVAALVRSTHEHYDGTGYPDGLAGDDIPLGARIISVCDAYHAMVTARPYRSARSPRAAREELRRCAGTKFDPAVVEAFHGFAGAISGRVAEDHPETTEEASAG